MVLHEHILQNLFNEFEHQIAFLAIAKFHSEWFALCQWSTMNEVQVQTDSM